MSRISVIIPVYNAAPFVERAIASVRTQNQDNCEIVVVNDGSTDRTHEAMDALGDAIIPLHQANAGASSARNAGVQASTGDYIAFLDADDLLYMDSLAALSTVLDMHPEFGLVAGGLDLVDENGRRLGTQRPWLHHPRITMEMLTIGGLSGPTGVMLRRSWFDEIGGFDTSITHVEDVDFWWRLLQAGCQMTWLRRPVGSYRIHQGSLSRSFILHHEKRIALLDRHLVTGVLPQSLVAQRPIVVARLTVAMAGRLFGAGDTAAGISALQEAMDLDSALRNPDAMAEAIANWRHDPRVEGRDSVVERMVERLPPSLAWIADQQRLIEQCYLRYNFYTSALENDRASVARSWLAIARHDLRWLANRGGWSLLAQSVGYKSQRAR